jgi:hypothetical protein
MKRYEDLLLEVSKSVQPFGRMQQEDITNLTRASMEAVEEEPIAGFEKKKLALKLMGDAVDHFAKKGSISEGSAELLQLSINTFGPAAIDLVVLATKKLIEVNVEAIKSCRAKCFPGKKKKK